MPGTHINAYYGAVAEAQAKLAVTQAALAEAEADLRAHPDYQEPETEKPASKK